MLSDILEDEIEVKEEFTVDTTEKAEWAINKMAIAESNIQRTERIYKQMLDKLNKWRTEQIEPLQYILENFAERLRPFCLQRTLQDKKQSVKFVQGTAKFRNSESLEVEDEEKVIEWLEKNYSGLIKIKKSFSKTEIKKLLENKEAVPGCKINRKINYTIEVTPIAAYLK